MAQEKEIQIIKQGVPLDVLPFDDDAEHLRVIERFYASKQFDELDQGTVALIASHAVQHRRQILLKQQQGQVQPGGSAANSVPTGLNQDLNALEGGIV